MILNKVFANHYLSGLLHGYGEENCEHFQQILNGEVKPNFSEKFEGLVTEKSFPLPIFAVAKNETMINKYEQQRKHIQQIYQNKNFFKTTLEFLQIE
jgi:hypothetical protein